MGGVPCQLAALPLPPPRRAAVQAELVVREVGQPRPKLQPVTATVAATLLVVGWRPGMRTPEAGEAQRRPCWLVKVRLDRVLRAPWWLLTDRSVETPEQATESFRLYCQR